MFHYMQISQGKWGEWWGVKLCDNYKQVKTAWKRKNVQGFRIRDQLVITWKYCDY